MTSLVVQMPQKKTEPRMEEDRITTSIKITPSVWKQFKKYAIDRDSEISTLLEEIIRKELEPSSKKHTQ